MLGGENLVKEKVGTVRCQWNLLKKNGLLGGTKPALSGGHMGGQGSQIGWQRLKQRQARA